MTAPASGDKAAKTRGELLTGPVFLMVVKFGVPTMVSMLTPAIYNLTGAYFVSTLGTTAVAALGIVFSLHMILAAVGIMTGQGCASQTSRLLGAGEYEAAGFIAGTGILLSVLGGVAIGVLGLLFDEPLANLDPATGKRFIKETGNRKVRADAIVAIGHPCVIYTCEANVMNAIVGHNMTDKLWEHALKTGVVKKFDTLKDLAAGYGIDYATLEKTNETFNGYMKAMKDPEFDCMFFKGASVNDKGPFYGVRL